MKHPRCPNCLEPEGHGHLPPCIPSTFIDAPLDEPNAIRRTIIRGELYEKAKNGKITEEDIFKDLHAKQ